jgi:hypothetical protein
VSHVMIDLETMGVGHNPCILSIGAIVFDPIDILGSSSVGAEGQFYQNIDLLSCVMAGLVVEPDTAKWWREQDPRAIDALDAHKEDLPGTLVELSNWLDRVDAEYIWTNGPMSDHVWLESAYRAVGMKTLMERKNGYRAPRDYRTIVQAAELVAGFDRTLIPTPTVAHDALADARAQAVGVQMAFAALRSGSRATDAAHDELEKATDHINDRRPGDPGAMALGKDEMEIFLESLARQPITVGAAAPRPMFPVTRTEEAGAKAALPVFGTVSDT